MHLDPERLHASAQAMLAHWRGMHPPTGLPGRQHFDPAAVPHLLANLVLVEVHRAPLRFRYRLLGSRVDSVKARCLSGQWLDEAYAGDPDCAGVLREYTEVVESRAPVWRRGQPRVAPDPNCHTIEALRLPLAVDGRTVDMVLGLVLYFDAAGQPFDLLARTGLGSTRAAAEACPTRGGPRSI
jgi:hypothetical protein